MRCAKAAGRKFTTDIWCELEMQAGTNIVYLAVFAASFWITPATRGIQNYIVNRITIEYLELNARAAVTASFHKRW